MIYLACDFETTVYPGQKSTEVWSFAIKHLYTHEYVWFNNIHDGMEYIRKLKSNVKCYFHNLKFDGSFILNYLLNNKKYKHGILGDGSLVKPKNLKDREFVYLIAGRGQFYNITVRYNRNTVIFADSLKLLPFTLHTIGKEFCVMYKKLDMPDYTHKSRFDAISDKEKEYIRADVDVLCEAMEIMLDRGHKNMTIGSCCLAEFREIFKKEKFGDFDTYFPDLTDVILPSGINAHDYVYASYKGAWCYLVDGKEDKIYHEGVTLDVNSLYPYVMGAYPYPVGRPVYTDNYTDFKEKCQNNKLYWFVHFKCKFEIRDGYLPFIQIKHDLRYSPTAMLKSSMVVFDDGSVSNETCEFTMTCTDFKRFNEFYSLTYFEFTDAVFFITEKGLFDGYINKYREIKETSTGAERLLAKLYLNNLYGKFATTDDSTYKVAHLEDNVLKFSYVTGKDKKVLYIPVGSAITSYARDYTIRHAQLNYHGADKPGFIYADTDSCHIDLPADECKGFDMHPTRFGAWDVEKEWDKGIFVRQKTYMEHDSNGWSITCAGMPDKCKEHFITELNSGVKKPEDFTHGLEVPGKLSFRQISGGAVLKEGSYTLK